MLLDIMNLQALSTGGYGVESDSVHARYRQNYLSYRFHVTDQEKLS